MVPANRKFIVSVPSLLQVPASSEMSQNFQVMTKHGEAMFHIKLLRHTPNPNESITIEEYFSVSLPDDVDKELIVCTFGRPRGPQLQCEIYKSEAQGQSSLFGIVREESVAQLGVTSYVLDLASRQRLLTVAVRGKVSDRNIKVLDGSKPNAEVAATVPGGGGDAPYQV